LFEVGTVLSALDLAFPTAVKCGGVSADLLPSRKRVAVAAYEREHGTHPLQAGVAGILLPPDVTRQSEIAGNHNDKTGWICLGSSQSQND